MILSIAVTSMSVQLRVVALPSGGVPAPRDSSMESVTRGYVMVSGVTWHYEKLCASRGLHRHPPSCRAGPQVEGAVMNRTASRTVVANHEKQSEMMEYVVKAETKEGDVVTLRRGFQSRSDAEDYPVRLYLWRRVWVESATTSFPQELPTP
jgi:hypothetical protein